LKASGFTTSTDVREGAAPERILEVAAEWRPDMIVIGSHGRQGLERLLLGSVAEHVMRHAACAVVLVPLAAHVAARQA
jgi:universal stress protein E